MITVTRNDNSEVHSADSAHVPSTGPNGPINTLNSRGAGSETGQAIVTHANLPPGDSATISRSTIRNQPPTDALHKADPLVPGTSSRSVSTRWIVRNRSRDSTGSCHHDSRSGLTAATFCSQSLAVRSSVVTRSRTCTGSNRLLAPQDRSTPPAQVR